MNDHHQIMHDAMQVQHHIGIRRAIVAVLQANVGSNDIPFLQNPMFG